MKNPTGPQPVTTGNPGGYHSITGVRPEGKSNNSDNTALRTHLQSRHGGNHTGYSLHRDLLRQQQGRFTAEGKHVPCHNGNQHQCALPTLTLPTQYCRRPGRQWGILGLCDYIGHCLLVSTLLSTVWFSGLGDCSLSKCISHSAFQ